MNVHDLTQSTILLVDDNLDALAPLSEYLQRQGFTVYAAEGGQQALDVVSDIRPDIILLDIMMPGLDGFDVCAHLKARQDTQHIPVVFMSGLSETVDKVMGFDVGGVDYLIKPFEYQEVVVRLAAHLRIGRLQQTLQENNRRLQQEIEQRQHAEAALRESEERFRTIFENAPVMITAYDERRGYTLWNTECERHLGYTKDEMMSYPSPLTLLFPEQASRMRVMSGITEADGAFREYPVLDKVGQTRMQLWATFRLPNGDVISVGHDITDRKHVEEALSESQQFARNIVESSLNIIIAVDNKRRIVEFNRAAEEVFGYQREEVIGKNVGFLYADPEEASLIGQTMVRKQQSILEVFNRRKNGEVFPCLLSASTLRDARGEAIGYMGISRDITALKQARAELQAAHDELKRKNEQLAELNASKDKFFSIIAHDLRGSFGTLLGFTQLVTENIDGYSKDRIKTFVGRVRTSAERLYALLENLLTWSRIQRGILKGSSREFNLYTVVRENLKFVTEQSEQKRITMHNRLPENINVCADISMIDTVLRNLISNALKFTPEGGQIDIEARDYDDEFWAIAVSDTGIGIPEEFLPRLLQLDTQYTTMGISGERGSGLGLILCKELVEHNHGMLWVTSEVDKGAIFTFTLRKNPPPQN